MKQINKLYSNYNDDELFEVIANIDQYTPEAKEIIYSELQKRNIDELIVKEKVNEIKNATKEKAEQSLNIWILIIFFIVGFPGVILGYFISSIYRANGYIKKSKQIWFWSLTGFTIQFFYFILKRFN